MIKKSLGCSRIIVLLTSIVFLGFIFFHSGFTYSQVKSSGKEGKAVVKSAKKAGKKADSSKQGKAKKVRAKKQAVREKKGKQAKAHKSQQEQKDPKSLAKEAYSEGKKLYEKGDYAGALDSFMKAYNYMPNPFVYISIAQCYDKLGKCGKARDYYLKYIQEKPDAGNVPSIKEKVTELESRKGKVRIISNPPGASITIDGEPLEAITPYEIELAGGDHAVALSKEGYIMETRAFTVPICGDVEVSVDLKSVVASQEIVSEKTVEEKIAEVEEKPEKTKRMKISLGLPHYISFGIAGAAAITAAVTGGLALKKSNEFANKKDEYEANPSQDLYEKLEDISSTGRPLAIVSDVCIGVAAVAAATGIALMFMKPRESRGEISLLPQLSGRSGGALFVIGF